MLKHKAWSIHKIAIPLYNTVHWGISVMVLLDTEVAATSVPDKSMTLIPQRTVCKSLKSLSSYSTNCIFSSGHTSWVISVHFSPDNEHFVSGSSDGTVKVRVDIWFIIVLLELEPSLCIPKIFFLYLFSLHTLHFSESWPF